MRKSNKLTLRTVNIKILTFNLERNTRFYDNLHQICSKSIDLKDFGSRNVVVASSSVFIYFVKIKHESNLI